MIRWLRALLGGCSHDHRRLEFDSDGALKLVCDCGHAVVALTRTDEDRARTARLQKRLKQKPKAKRPKKGPAEVVDINRHA